METSTSSSVQLAYSILTFRNIVLSLLLYVALQCSYQVVYYRFFHPLAKFPGPFWAGVTRLWVAYPDLTGQERPKECQELHKRFGGGFFNCIRSFQHEDCGRYEANCLPSLQGLLFALRRQCCSSAPAQRCPRSIVGMRTRQKRISRAALASRKIYSMYKIRNSMPKCESS